MSYKRIFIILLPLLMASCVTSKRVNLMQEPGKNGIPQYADTISYEDYELRIGDRLYIYVYSVDERVNKMFNSSSGTIGLQMLQGGGGVGGSYDLYTYLVQSDGCIDFPMVGRIPVRGLTTRNVKAILEEELSSFIKSYGEYQMTSVDVKIVRRSFSVISDRGSGTFNIRYNRQLLICNSVNQRRFTAIGATKKGNMRPF